ncbi:hypothetical protein ACFV4M_03875 [Kitasatospora indigofera]|uniref:hypothetical protein n=1 Tax=Kitasatospora indigofera TaxID=67307 RepID=UPI0036486356
MPTQWVHQLRDCPDAEDVEALAEEEGRPRQILARQRPGDDGGLIDGYVLQRIDAQSHTAVYTWVLAGDPGQMTEYLLDLLAKVCPVERAR